MKSPVREVVRLNRRDNLVCGEVVTAQSAAGPDGSCKIDDLVLAMPLLSVFGEFINLEEFIRSLKKLAFRTNARGPAH
jgi:hypothetical protein